jgi:hypothetical protein
MATVVLDNFTDTDGTSLDAHTPDTRPGSNMWTELVGNWQITSNRAVIVTATNQAKATIDSGTADGVISASLLRNGGTNSTQRDTAILFRYTDASNYWHVGLNDVADLFRIVQTTGGTQTVRASQAWTLNPTQFHTVELTLDGDDMSATLDGGTAITYNSSQGNTSTVHGIYGRDVSTGAAFEWFQVDTVAGVYDLTAQDIATGAPSVTSADLYIDVLTFTDGSGGDVFSADDTLMSSGWPTNNGGAHSAHAFASIQRCLWRFDLESLAGVTLLAAQMKLYKERADAEGTVNCRIHRVSVANGDWVAGNNDISLADAGECCWNAKVADGAGGVTTAWAGSAGLGTVGTDYETEPIAQGTYNFSLGAGTEYVFDLDTDRIAEWLGDASNPGFVGWTPDSAGDHHTAQSDHGTAAYRPKLVITYVLAATQYDQSVSGTLTSAGALSKQTGHGLSGTLTSAGALLKQVSHELSGALTSAGALAKQTARSLSGAMTSAGAAAKSTGHSLSGSMTSAGDLSKQVGKSLSGTLTSAGAKLLQVGKSLSGSMSSTGVLDAARTFTAVISGSMASAGALAKQTGKSLSGSLTSAGSLTRQVGLALSGVLSSAGSLAKSTARSLSGSMASSGAVSAVRTFAVQLTGSMSSAGALLKQTGHSMSGALTSAGDLIAQFIGGSTAYFQDLFGGMSSSGSLTRSVDKNLTGDLPSAGVLNKFTSRFLSGLLTSIGTLLGTWFGPVPHVHYLDVRVDRETWLVFEEVRSDRLDLFEFREHSIVFTEELL